MIELSGIRKTFPAAHGNAAGVTALDDVSLHFEAGRIHVLIGPSGCGKTTLLKTVNRLIEPDAGTVTIDGRNALTYDAVKLRRSIGYVIQEVGLFPHYDVFGNIAVVPRLSGWTEERIRERVRELLELTNLDASCAQKYPAQLSGGERQRVGLARALAADPNILLMDEAFGQIDPINRLALHEAFLEIQNKLRKTIVAVSHDMGEAFRLGDRIAVMDAGRVVQYAEPRELLDAPANDFVAQLLRGDLDLHGILAKKAAGR